MLDVIGRIRGDLGDFERSRSNLSRALALVRALRGEEHAETGQALGNLATLDLYPLFRQLGATQALFYRLDMHLNEYGNRIVADAVAKWIAEEQVFGCLLYTSPSPRDRTRSRMPSSA